MIIRFCERVLRNPLILEQIQKETIELLYIKLTDIETVPKTLISEVSFSSEEIRLQ